MERVDADLVPFAQNNPSGYRFAFGTDTATDDINVNYNDNIKKGWGTTPNEFPEVEDFNAFAYTSGYLTAYLYQMGISEWNDKQKYKQYSRVIGSDGKIYKAKTGTDLSPNVDNNPTTDTTNWEDEATNRIGLIEYAYVEKNYHIVAFGGEFNRADYPKLWAYLQANPSLVKTQAQWTTESTANGGICGFFSDGDGTTTFRVPNLDEAFLRPTSRTAGSFQEGSYTVGDSSLTTPQTAALLNYDNNISTFRSRVNWDALAPTKIGDSNLKLTTVDASLIFDYLITESSFGVTRPKNIAVLPLIVAK